MSKKFKLIKEYPGSPKLETTVTYDPESIMFIVNDDILIDHSLVYGFPEFWQELKAYEILEYKINNKIYKLDDHGFYNNGVDRERISKSFIDSKHIFKIHSVKRLSDGKVFTVGDKVKSAFKATIIAFEINDLFVSTGLGVYTDKWIVESYDNCDLSCITKDNLILKTEDGVEIYEHTIVHWVIAKNCSYIQDITTDNIFTLLSDFNNKFFSTKKAAMDYIILNKRCLSIKDIIELDKKMPLTELKKVVKSRIVNI